jgi:hypothetical protein
VVSGFLLQAIENIAHINRIRVTTGFALSLRQYSARPED